MLTPELLRKLEHLEISSRRQFLGVRQGRRVSPKRGHGIEFSDYREYQPGDSPRNIDWSLYARSDRLYVKTYQEEQNLSVLLLLDASASMRNPEESGKWDFASDLILSLGYIALKGQDTVSVCAIDSFLLRNLSSGRALYRVNEALKESAVGDPTRFSAEIKRAVSSIRFPGVAIIVSDFLFPIEEVIAGFMPLLAKNLDITALQITSSTDFDPLEGATSATVRDSETGEIKELFIGASELEELSSLYNNHNEDLREFFARSGINYAKADVQSELFSVLTESIASTGLIR